MLAQNEGLVDIVQRLDRREPHWDEVVPRFLKSLKYTRENYCAGRIASRLSELHIRVELERIAEESRHNVEFDPIKDGRYTRNYSFQFKRGDNLRIVDKNTGKLYAELDGLMIVDYLPVVLEVKLLKGSWIRKKDRKKIALKGLKSDPFVPYKIEYAMSEERIRHVTGPIKEFFNSPCAYVLITWDEIIRLDSPVKEEFLKRNGIMASLYGNSKVYRKDVHRIVKEYKLPVWH